MDNSDKQNAKFLGEVHEELKSKLLKMQLDNAIFERDFLLNALKSITGTEPWIGDKQIKEHFQKVVYGAIKSIEKQNQSFFIGTENGIADIETPPSYN